ncbi:5-carboxymethyl-2-hydroxymuconate Delta-isomerase [Legionella cardiaca]|uniref:5-carboxymethyl-2-hydroxymuconate Delta-isomerase n=1 Tax=Legionella cardiaca TaxID=1071983 RepID=A0ABY8AST1_9GAMM|nr:5-carboxymethyl-2-hydroxymuconate Delta-isomerase [Legionella cardiaca]WED42565.1 5-carboxymethyl-2-hydroxymuconate Delta-isomerase [Legionella cardiaca]
MPHLTLEYSSNIGEKKSLSVFFAQCHAILASALPTNLASCKSRAICHDIYYIGNGHVANAFIHLDIKIMTGRSDNVLQKASEQIFQLLDSYFSESKKNLSLQLSVDLHELGKHYLKTSNSMMT